MAQTMRYGAELSKMSVLDAEIKIETIEYTDNTVSYVMPTSDRRTAIAMWSKVTLSFLIED